MGIRYVGLCQAIASAKKDLVVVCSGYQICRVIQSGSKARNDLLVIYNRHQVYGVIPSSKRAKKDLPCWQGKEGPAGGL